MEQDSSVYTLGVHEVPNGGSSGGSAQRNEHRQQILQDKIAEGSDDERPIFQV